MEIIKLYETGRLYSKTLSKYVPKSYIPKLIVEGREFKIIKEYSNEDVTHHYKFVYSVPLNGVELIKKYHGNRKMYSTLRNKYLTLKDIQKLVENKKDFKVVCTKTFKDLTNETILKANYTLKLDQIKQEQVGI